MTLNALQLHPPVDEMCEIWHRLVIAVRITGEVAITIAGYKADVPAIVDGDRIHARFTALGHFNAIGELAIRFGERRIISRFTDTFRLGKNDVLKLTWCEPTLLGRAACRVDKLTTLGNSVHTDSGLFSETR